MAAKMLDASQHVPCPSDFNKCWAMDYFRIALSMEFGDSGDNVLKLALDISPIDTTEYASATFTPISPLWPMLIVCDCLTGFCWMVRDHNVELRGKRPMRLDVIFGG